MNILMISMDYPPVPGGISAHVHELARTMHDAGHRVAVVCRRRRGQPERATNNGVAVYRVSLRYMALIYGLQIRRFVRRLLPELRPDIIHIHGMGPLEWYNIDHIPLVYTNHTSGYLRRIAKGGRRRMAMLKRLFAKVDVFLAPSEELLHVPFPIKAPRIFIPNGVDASRFLFPEGLRDKVRSELGVGVKSRVAVITRRLVDKNGVIHLARAAKLIHDKDVIFIVIGDGPERQAVEKEFIANCGNRAIFLGNKRHEEIVPYYSAADFSVLPSLLEATSISGLEAMAAGLPLVGTRVGGIPELIQDGVNGYLCEPADPHDLAAKIDQLLTADLAHFGQNSRRFVEEKFDWRIIAEKTLAAYRQFL
jgi:glycosyltransferase involved in cell wall biosynthesis